MLEAKTLVHERYQIESQIGEGGMGAVYQAIDLRLGTVVALKQTTRPDLGKVFELEAKRLARLDHRALPRVTDYFNDPHGQFLVMNYIPGPNLAELLAQRGGPFPMEEVLSWADQLLDAVIYLHSQPQPVIHRDIKPANLKLTREATMMLLDFGLAKGGTIESLETAVADRSVHGYSINYAPLEQIDGTGTDHRSDLYALGATIYHLLAGKPPRDAQIRAAAKDLGVIDPLKPLHTLNRDVPKAVSDVIMRALALNAGDRPTSALEMRLALRVARSAPMVTDAARATKAEFLVHRRAERPIWSWRSLAGVGFAALALGAVLVVLIARLNLVAGLSVGQQVTQEPVPSIGSTLNIAVAEFSVADAQGESGHALDLGAIADAVYQEVGRSDAPSGFDIQTRPPAQIGPVVAQTAAERASRAAQMAAAANADIFIYGTLTVDADTTNFTAAMYISERKLKGAEELAGHHELVAFRAQDDIMQHLSSPIRDDIVQRTDAMTQFMIGLDYVNRQEFAQAALYFEAAENSGGWGDDDGAIQLFQGIVATKLPEPDQKAAQEYFQTALARNPEYARAQLELGDVLYQTARKHEGQPEKDLCQEQTADPDGLNAAIDYYRQVLSGGLEPPLADLEARARLGLGRAYICMTRIMKQAYNLSEAETLLQNNVNAYQRQPSEALQDVAGESYAYLGRIYEYQASIDRTRTPTIQYPRAIEAHQTAIKLSYRRAIEAHQTAIKLSSDPALLAPSYNLLARLYTAHVELRNCNDAEAALDAAQAAYEQVYPGKANEEVAIDPIPWEDYEEYC